MKLSELFGMPLSFDKETGVRPLKTGLPYPAVNPAFVFSETRLRKLLRFFAGAAARNNLLLTGPTGAGKTSVIEQMAARLNWPLWSVSCSGKVRVANWLGSYGLKNGATFWQDGPMLQAMREGGVFLADEVTRLAAEEQMALVRTLDGSSVTVPETGETIIPHRLFRFVATGNSGGFGDDTGAYAGERVASYAFVDRFLKMDVDYLSQDEESLLLKRIVPKLNIISRNVLVKLASTIRQQFAGAGKGGGLRIGISTRGLVAMAKESYAYMEMGFEEPLLEALNDVVLNGAPQDDAAAVRDLLTKFLQESKPF